MNPKDAAALAAPSERMGFGGARPRRWDGGGHGLAGTYSFLLPPASSAVKLG